MALVMDAINADKRESPREQRQRERAWQASRERDREAERAARAERAWQASREREQASEQAQHQHPANFPTSSIATNAPPTSFSSLLASTSPNYASDRFRQQLYQYTGNPRAALPKAAEAQVPYAAPAISKEPIWKEGRTAYQSPYAQPQPADAHRKAEIEYQATQDWLERGNRETGLNIFGGIASSVLPTGSGILSGLASLAGKKLAGNAGTLANHAIGSYTDKLSGEELAYAKAYQQSLAADANQLKNQPIAKYSTYVKYIPIVGGILGAFREGVLRRHTVENTLKHRNNAASRRVLAEQQVKWEQPREQERQEREPPYYSDSPTMSHRLFPHLYHNFPPLAGLWDRLHISSK